MSTHNIYFYGELMKIVLQLSSNTHLICSSDYESPKACVKYCVGCLGAWYFSEGSIELSAISRQFMIWPKQFWKLHINRAGKILKIVTYPTLQIVKTYACTGNIQIIHLSFSKLLLAMTRSFFQNRLKSKHTQITYTNGNAMTVFFLLCHVSLPCHAV